MADFEVLLISIDWECPDKVRNIIQSKKSLEASNINGNKYEYDIVLYTKEDDLFFQFALKCKYKPYIKNREDKWIQLYPINNDLWIVKGDWKIGAKGIGYHDCQSINRMGKITIGFRNSDKDPYYITIDINSSIEDFDFAQLKNDFEGELWNLITSNKSNVSSDKIDFQYGEKTIHYPENKSIEEFIQAFQHISKSPKRELSSTKEIRRSEKVIPIAETYRKLSTVGTSSLLPSKGVLENYDIFENRFVCYMLYRIYSIVTNNIKYTPLSLLNEEIVKLTKKINELQVLDPKVNPDEIDQEISYLQHFYNDLIKRWKTISDNLPMKPKGECNHIRIRIKYLHDSVANIYFCSTSELGFCLFKFPTHIVKYISLVDEFQFEGIYNQIGTYTARRSGKEYSIFEMTAVRKIGSTELFKVQNTINHQKKNKSKLEKNEWKQSSILSDSEKIRFTQERNNQTQTLNKKIEKINNQIQNISQFNKEQSELLVLIEQKINTTFFKTTNWKNFQGFKPSMTFIQNISYRNALRNYYDILKSEGIDIEAFGLYENITSYGLREMPQVYELWCLVTIIKVLEESFHLSHVPKDLTTLLTVINPKNETISRYSKIEFKNKLAGRSVILHYQKSLENNKRPDFILEISIEGYAINLVLDSKFKNYKYKKSIVEETLDMKDKYQGNNSVFQKENFVFILHPCKDGIYDNRSIKYTNLGGDKIFYGTDIDKKIEFPFHKFGYIELKPNLTDNLKKVIAMGFEYLLEQNKSADSNKDPKPEHPLFCISCGGDSLTEVKKEYPSGGFYYKYICNSQECNHEINLSYCWNCKTKLFKHGSYWDYHLESSWSIFDIKCPKCGMTLIDRAT